ncbi:uncharacterized protein [Ptychodera flava]|uniref:uncharacterized protein n=1 Tax=Ptychodera flava TaxID=63121 RepID=UPI003969E456
MDTDTEDTTDRGTLDAPKAIVLLISAAIIFILVICGACLSISGLLDVIASEPESQLKEVDTAGHSLNANKTSYVLVGLQVAVLFISGIAVHHIMYRKNRA